MEIQVKILAARKPAFIASAKVLLTFDDGTKIVIDDYRVLKNKEGNFWAAPPTFATPSGAKTWDYSPVVSFSKDAKRDIELAIVDAFEAQQPQSAQTSTEDVGF